MLAWILAFLLPFLAMGGQTTTPAHITVPAQASTTTDESEWQEYHALAYAEYSAEFTALFNSYETRWSKNGRLMMRNGNTGPYKFVKRAI